jgi:hypothetical protein
MDADHDIGLVNRRSGISVPRDLLGLLLRDCGFCSPRPAGRVQRNDLECGFPAKTGNPRWVVVRATLCAVSGLWVLLVASPADAATFSVTATAGAQNKEPVTTYSGFWNPRATDKLLAVMSAAADNSSYDFDTVHAHLTGSCRHKPFPRLRPTAPIPPSMAV